MPRIPRSKPTFTVPSGGVPHGWAPMPAATEPGAAPGLAQRLVLGCLRAYKLLISPYFAGSCRFVPSCADYAIEAVTWRGALRGSLLAIRRLSRCHPLGGHGLDQVPPSSTHV